MLPPVFLDIDGTLLPFGASTGDDSLMSGLDARHGTRLSELPCELVWATTWMAEANRTIAPALGLPALPVLDPLPPTAEDDWFGPHWKTRAIVERAGGRPFAWLDDEITAADREWIADRHPAPALLLVMDPHHGLTTIDLDTLERWLAEVAGSTTEATTPRPPRT